MSAAATSSGREPEAPVDVLLGPHVHRSELLGRSPRRVLAAAAWHSPGMVAGRQSTAVAGAAAALEALLAADDPEVVGVVLSGSAARGRNTDRSDVDVHVVLAEGCAPREVQRSAELDLVAVPLPELEQPPPFGSEGWAYRWSYAWAPVLRDTTGGRVTAAVRRQATLHPSERAAVLTARLDGYLNLTYRALKSDRDGRRLECRLDAAESVPWLLDVVFALSDRVRPYGSYLAWELRRHPLSVPEWSADVLLPQLEGLLDGAPDAVRDVAAVVERECRRADAAEAQPRWGGVFDAWGADLDLVRRPAG